MQKNLNELPPRIRFERRAVEDRQASSTAGHYVAKDVDFVILQRPGSRDTVEKEAEAFLREWDDKARQDLLPQSWALEARAGYEHWKRGEELPVSGTAIKAWPVLSPAQQKMVIAAGIRTVEELAALPDGSIGVLGIGGISLKAKAASWLTEAQTKGVVSEQNAQLKVQLAEQQAQIEELRRLVGELQAASPKPPEAPLTMAQAFAPTPKAVK